ncbi:MAG TPA: glycosyltransferase [Geobacterales bacterium]|nr:glycosyltransferase [Geobacterales bacterium]
MPFSLDIVVPVWNRPLETRSCLVDLSKYAPDARIIMVDNGSDQETERLLEEFAEILGERAMFLRSGYNHGFVKALNRGLSMASAPLLAVVRSSSRVTEGWLTPMTTLVARRRDVGVVVPRLLKFDGAVPRNVRAELSPPVEISHGSFAAMLFRKELYDAIGGFDEEFDSGYYALKDYSRRAYRAGYLTFAAEGAPVFFEEEQQLGSLARREELTRRSRHTFRQQWGEEQQFCIYLPKRMPVSQVRERMGMVVRAARIGHELTVLAHPSIYKTLVKEGGEHLHRKVHLSRLPRFFSDGAVKQQVNRLRVKDRTCRMVPASDTIRFPGMEGIMTFAEFERLIVTTERDFYCRS